MNKVLTVVFFLLMSIGAWAGEVIIVKNPSNGGSVVASEASAGQTCTLTVTPASGKYLKSIKAVTLVNGNAIQAPARRTGIDIDETELTISSDATADPSGVTTHTFTMPTDENLNVEVTAEFEARIDISDAVITLATSEFTYDGTAKEPAVSSVKLETTTLNTNEYSVSYSNNVNVSATASPTVTVTGARQYTGTVTKTFTINKASLSLTVSLEGWTYGATANTPSVSGNSGEGAVTYTYKAEGAEEFTETQPIVAGTHTIKATVAETGNYQGGEATNTFIISKAAITPTVTLAGWTYGATASTPSVSGNLGNGGVIYTYKAEGAEEYTSTQPTAAGTHTIKAVIAETANYQGAETTNTFIISKAAITPTVTLAGWKFGATANNPSVSGNSGNGAVTYTYKAAGATEFTETQPTAVGTHTVKAVIAETDNYQGGEATNTFNIEKGDLSMVSVSVPEELVYDGNVHQLITVSNVPEGATAKYYWSEISEEEYEHSGYLLCDPGENSFSTTVPTIKNAGYYAIIYMVNGGANYNNIPASQTQKVAIDPATITEMALSATSLPYNSSDQTVTITSVKAGELTADDYTVKLNNEAVTAGIKAKAVGKYTVEVTGKGNFTGTKSATFSIVNRTLAANEVAFNNHWATYFSADGDVELPSGIGAFVATGIGDGVVTVSQIKYIPEYVPVLLNNETANAGTVEFDIEEGTNLLQHAFEDFEVGENLIYGLYNGKMMRVTGTIPAGKNYLSPYYDGPVAPRLDIVIDGEEKTTSVKGINNNMADERGDYYDLSGRKFSSMPSKNGLYIKNGRKVVVNK